MIRETDSENFVAACVCLHPERMADVLTQGVRPEAFGGEARLVMDACYDLFERGELTSRQVVKSELKAKGTFSEIGEKGWSDLSALGHAEEDLEYHLGRVRRAHWLRRQEYQLGKARFELQKEHRDLDRKEQAVKEARDQLLWTEAERKDTLFSASDLGKRQQEQMQGERDMLFHSPTGLMGYDEHFHGLPVGRITAVVGRTNHGKGAFVDQVMLNHARRWQDSDRVAVKFDLENGPQEVQTRLISNLTWGSEHRVGATQVERYLQGDIDLSQNQEACVHEAAQTMEELPFYVDTAGGIDATHIRARLASLSAKHDIGLVIVDYLTLMNEDGDGKTDRAMRALEKMHAIIKEYEAPLVVVSQTNRNQHNRASGEPLISDVSWVDALVQYARKVIMVYHEWTYWDSEGREVDEPDPTLYDVYVRKNKGPQGGRTLRIYRNFLRIVDPKDPAYSERLPTNGHAPVPDDDTPF